MHIAPRFTFTAHSLGAQKLEPLLICSHSDIEQLDREFPVVICSIRLAPKKNHIGLVLAFARSSELQDSANLLLVVPGLEALRPGMELGKEAEPVLREIAAACESAQLWGRDADRRRVLERYTWETMAAGYPGVLEEILRTETARPERLPIPAYFMTRGPDTGIDILRGIASPPPASAS